MSPRRISEIERLMQSTIIDSEENKSAITIAETKEGKVILGWIKDALAEYRKIDYAYAPRELNINDTNALMRAISELNMELERRYQWKTKWWGE